MATIVKTFPVDEVGNALIGQQFGAYGLGRGLAMNTGTVDLTAYYEVALNPVRR